jgi:hypothetical protein
MTPTRCVAVVAPLIGALWGCSANSEQTAQVIAISPATAFNDIAFPASIVGDSFRPIYRFDTMAAATDEDSGAFSVHLRPVGGSDADAVALEGVTWTSPQGISATVPAGVPAGMYDVVVTDPRGTSVQLDAGFLSLGPDGVAPVVSIERPAPRALIAAGTPVTVAVVADDGDGFLATLGATIVGLGNEAELVCNVSPPPHQARCQHQFIAPDPSDENAAVVVNPHAKDTARNEAPAARASFRLVPRPTLSYVSPQTGPATGGTEIVVEGTGFVAPLDGSDGTRLLLDGRMIEPKEITPTTIHAVMPQHDPGPAVLTVANGDAESAPLTFQFVGAPIVRMASPLTGPVTGGTRISVVGNNFRNPETRIYIGNLQLLCQKFVGQFRIEGIVPPAQNGPGSVLIVATDDPLQATSVLDESFVYEPVASDSPDGGVEPPACPGSP